ncbi:UDP-glucuronosyltransferase 1-1 [Clydaea vesicula]|uniref:UDP-glucuronosyltransferase 1-1 n=1 Tax=Clydaea vesicula TaxID=447962 RepID=A0AAD5U5X7_9FUNG|nr:UDP-glucuronosyltransferase 1-1 [Clydaea vesicula]
MKFLLISVPTPGHVNPLLSLAIELLEKNHTVEFMVSEIYIEKLKEKNIKNLILTSNGNVGFDQTFFSKMTNSTQESLFQLMFTVKNFALPRILSYLDAIVDILSLKFKVEKYDSLIVDFILAPVTSVADIFNVPVIIYNPGVTPYGLYDPDAFSFPSWSYYLTPEMDFYSRLKNFVFKSFTEVIIFNLLNYKINDIQKKVGLNKTTRLEFFRKKLVISTSLPGLDFPLPRFPKMQLTGPCLNLKSNLRLSHELTAWLDDPVELPVVYVSFGSIGASPKHITPMLNSVFQSFQKQVRFLFATLALSQVQEVEKYKWSTNVRLEMNGVPQLNVLEHKSHCGGNSMFESMHFGKPILCIPLGADQYTLANRVIYVEVGSAILTSEYDFENKLENLIKLILKNAKYKKNAEDLGEWIRIQNSCSMQVNLIEASGKNLTKFLFPKQIQPNTQFFNFDLQFDVNALKAKKNSLKVKECIMSDLSSEIVKHNSNAVNFVNNFKEIGEFSDYEDNFSKFTSGFSESVKFLDDSLNNLKEKFEVTIESENFYKEISERIEKIPIEK